MNENIRNFDNKEKKRIKFLKAYKTWNKYILFIYQYD